MKHRLFLPLIIASAIITGVIIRSSELTAGSPQQAPPEHRFHVGKLDNHWKVYEPDNHKHRIITASRGDKVIWTAAGSDLSFQFTDETIFGTTEANVADGEELNLTVSPDAKPGRYTYAIFCIGEKKFATGDSPPVIIVK